MTSEDKKFTVIDVPGTNDSGGSKDVCRLTNEVIATMFVKTLESGFLDEEQQGLNAITHVVMVDKSLRIKSELMKTIGDILLMFTMNYPDFNI